MIFGIKPTINVWIRCILDNKNITSSARFHCFSVYFRFFRRFRSPVTRAKDDFLSLAKNRLFISQICDTRNRFWVLNYKNNLWTRIISKIYFHIMAYFAFCHLLIGWLWCNLCVGSGSWSRLLNSRQHPFDNHDSILMF